MSKLDHLRSMTKGKRKKLFFIGIFGIFFFTGLIVIKIKSDRYLNFFMVLGLLLMFHLTIKNRGQSNEGKSNCDISIDQLPFKIDNLKRDSEISNLNRFSFFNNSNYIVTTFYISGSAPSMNMMQDYKIVSTVFPGDGSSSIIENYPKDFRIKRIGYTHLTRNNESVFTEYDLEAKVYKMLNDQESRQKLKISEKFAVGYLLLYLVFTLIFLNNYINPSELNSTSNTGYVQNEVLTENENSGIQPEVTIEDIQFDEESSDCYIDSINNCWFTGRFINNSEYPITELIITVVENNTGERSYLIYRDTVLPGEKSPEAKTILAHRVDESFQPEVDTGEMKYTYKKGDGQYIHIKIDTKLGEYKYDF